MQINITLTTESLQAPEVKALIVAATENFKVNSDRSRESMKQQALDRADYEGKLIDACVHELKERLDAAQATARRVPSKPKRD